MAVTNLKPTGSIGKTMISNDLIGDGAPASTDALVTQVKKYPVGTRYYDKTNFKLYIRHAIAAATTDFKSVTLA